jgi:prepilin-type N-terminal cleavage/methylation domain-containing protein
MSTSLKPQLRKALLRKISSNKSLLQQGFTLIEILVVVVIIAILAAIALPAFLGQANKAKVSSAKTLASAAARECQVALVEGQQDSYTITTGGAGDVTTNWTAGVAAPSTQCEGQFITTVSAPNLYNFTAEVTSAGAVTKTCGGTDVDTTLCSGNW